MEDVKPYICILCGEITWETANVFIKETYEAFIKQDINRIIISISTLGGDADAAWSIYTALKHLGCDIITIANGRVYSAGVILFLIGKKRYCFDESLFLFHPSVVVTTGTDEKPAYRIQEEINGQKIDEKLFRKVLEKTLTNATKKDIMKLTHRHKSVFVNAEEGLRLGLVTDIVETITDINLG